MQEGTLDVPAARLEHARLLHVALRSSAADPRLVAELFDAREPHSYSVLDYLMEQSQRKGTLGDPPGGACRARSPAPRLGSGPAPSTRPLTLTPTLVLTLT